MLVLTLLTVTTQAYGPEDDDGRGGEHSSSRHGHVKSGNGGRLLGENGHGQFNGGGGGSNSFGGGSGRLLGADGHGQRQFGHGDQHGPDSYSRNFISDRAQAQYSNLLFLFRNQGILIKAA